MEDIATQHLLYFLSNHSLKFFQKFSSFSILKPEFSILLFSKGPPEPDAPGSSPAGPAFHRQSRNTLPATTLYAGGSVNLCWHNVLRTRESAVRRCANNLFPPHRFSLHQNKLLLRSLNNLKYQNNRLRRKSHISCNQSRL